MAVVRFTPTAQSPRFFSGTQQLSPGQGQQALGGAIKNLGEGLSDFAQQQKALEAKEAEAMGRATAHSSANTLGIQAQAAVDDLRLRLQKEGREEAFREEALDTVNAMAEETFTQYQSSPHANQTAFLQAREEILQPIRAGIVKEYRGLVVQKNLRELSTSVDNFVRHSDTSFKDIDYQFQRLQTRADEMERDLVIDRKGKVDVLEGAMVEMLKRRQRYLIETDPDHAEAQFNAEARYFNSYLSPLYAEKLREAQGKGANEMRAEQERQLINGVTYNAMPLDAAMGEAVRLGLDASKIEEAWANHNNRQHQYLEHIRTGDERVFKARSDELRTSFTLRASKEKGFDLRSAVDKNLRELTGEDARALINVAEANEKALEAPSASDPDSIRMLRRMVADSPQAPSTERAIFAAVKNKQISKPDYEQLLDKLYANRKELKTEGKTRQHQIYTEGQHDLTDALKTTSTLEFDPVANTVRDRWTSRLRSAMFGPEQRKGDQDAFHADPLGFVARLKSEGRMELESSIAQEAIKTLRAIPVLINPETATLNLEAVRLARKEGILTNVEAERIFFLDQLVKQGAIQLPFKPVPPPQPTVQPEEKSLFEQFSEFFTGPGKASAGPTEKKSDRKATREKKF